VVSNFCSYFAFVPNEVHYFFFSFHALPEPAGIAFHLMSPGMVMNIVKSFTSEMKSTTVVPVEFHWARRKKMKTPIWAKATYLGGESGFLLFCNQRMDILVVEQDRVHSQNSGHFLCSEERPKGNPSVKAAFNEARRRALVRIRRRMLGRR